MYSYPGVKRAFDDDSEKANYVADAANLAWSRTVDFLHRTLGWARIWLRVKEQTLSVFSPNRAVREP
jgi:hypothetical protein